LWESVLPQVCLRLPVELERVDAWLGDERFFVPFVPYFDPRIGRPSVPMETYPRLMFLKFRYRLGYETLCAEVADSISWRRFCRIDIDGRVPHPTTLMKITTRCGEQAVAQLNDTLLAKAVAPKLVRTGKVRADTTVVSADVEYPTDSDLLAHAVVKIGRLVTRIKAAGGARRTVFRNPKPRRTDRNAGKASSCARACCCRAISCMTGISAKRVSCSRLIRSFRKASGSKLFNYYLRHNACAMVTSRAR
jgi:IS5 family transposase